MDVQLEVAHRGPARADEARRATEAVLEAVRRWAAAPKYQVGAVALPGDLDASVAFDAFHLARRRLAYHVGGEAASRWAAGALWDAAGTG